MPTVTTTVTSAASCGKTTTVTTTEATPEPVSAAAGGAVAAAAEPAAKPILKDGIEINASHWPKAGVPVGPGDITAEWFTTVFQSRGLIGMSTTVSAIESKQIGEGRGYANYTFLVKLTFSRAVNPDVPTAVALKIANQTFQKTMLSPKPPSIWEFFNNFYVCESKFYEDYRQTLKCACPKLYWSEIEYPADPRTEFGAYGLMIEYLGDDLKMFSIEDGIPAIELREALSAVATLHAGSWNDQYCCPIRQGGSNSYFNDGKDVSELIIDFVSAGFPTYVKLMTEKTAGDAACADMISELTFVYENISVWYAHSEQGNQVLSSMDLRAENLLWKKNSSKPSGYECYPIDHQAWSFTAPMRDIATLLFTSPQAAEIGNSMTYARFYYDALVAAGVSGDAYTWEMCQDDFAMSMYGALIFAGAIVEFLQVLKDGFAGMDGSEDNFEETKSMVANVTSMFDTFSTKAVLGFKSIPVDRRKKAIAVIKSLAAAAQ